MPAPWNASGWDAYIYYRARRGFILPDYAQWLKYKGTLISRLVSGARGSIFLRGRRQTKIEPEWINLFCLCINIRKTSSRILFISGISKFICICIYQYILIILYTYYVIILYIYILLL